MFDKFLFFFKETDGLSNLRFNSTIMTISICICILYLTIFLSINIWEAYIALYAIAMGAKVTQKFAENKGVNTNV